MDECPHPNWQSKEMPHPIGSPFPPFDQPYYDALKDVWVNPVVPNSKYPSVIVDHTSNPTGTKHDQGKARMSLLDSSWLLGVAEVLGFGEKKYAAHNWRKGLSVSRLMDAAARHQASFNDGEDLDPESGKSHLYHASCCLMFASWMIKNRPDLDDRYKP